MSQEWVTAIMSILYILGGVLFLITAYVCFIGAPFIPTPQGVVNHMVKAAKLKSGMRVLDPGCGDARMILTAVRNHPGVTGLGYELFFVPYLLALFRTWKYRNRIKIFFRNSDYADLTSTDVMFCYMLQKPMQRNSEKYKRELKKGAKIISYAFEIPGWKYDEKLPSVPEKNFGPVFIYKM
jgi:hypothetical protein